MKRRDFLRWSVAAVCAGSGLSLAPQAQAADGGFAGPYVLTVHAAGGWDTTMLCDPKGEAAANSLHPVNHYLRSDIVQIGPFRVPPLAEVVDFFTAHQQRLLVINGIDHGTNSHEVGSRVTWSGSLRAGTPSLAALYAASRPQLPALPLLLSGGYEETAGLVAATRLPDSRVLQGLAYPDRLNAANPKSSLWPAGIQQRLQAARKARLQRLQQQSSLRKAKQAMAALQTARSSNNELTALLKLMPTKLKTSDAFTRQAQLTLASFQAGLTASANLSMGSFDSHGNHDAAQTTKLEQLMRGLQFIMAEAERLGIADQLILLVGSDMGRTPFYNAQRGKDHWSIGSMLLLGPGIQGGRVVGATDDGLHALPIDPATLASVADGGVRLTPGHVHAALRTLLGINNHALASRYPVADLLPLLV